MTADSTDSPPTRRTGPRPLDAAALLRRNADWAAGRAAVEPGFFQRLVGQQRPKFFWIGCCDSRVPATEIVDLDPGEMFVHRNVANLVPRDDPNFAAALQFAVSELRVEHIIVTGHYGCGGIQGVLDGSATGPLAQWLRPIREIMDANDGADETVDAWTPDSLCEANVLAQVDGLAANPIVQAAWHEGHKPALHGWVYAIGDGLLRALCGPIDRRSATVSPRQRDHRVPFG